MVGLNRLAEGKKDRLKLPGQLLNAHENSLNLLPQHLIMLFPRNDLLPVLLPPIVQCVKYGP